MFEKKKYTITDDAEWKLLQLIDGLQDVIIECQRRILRLEDEVRELKIKKQEG